MRSVSAFSMTVAVLVSWASMLAHNLYELPLTPLDVENSGPLAVAAALGVAHLARPQSSVVAAGALTWGALNLVIGGIATVLPLPILPFAPEQSLSHYGAHFVYAVGQLPLVVAAYRALVRPVGQRGVAAPDVAAR